MIVKMCYWQILYRPYKQKPRLKKIIYLNNEYEFKEEEIAFFIVTLNTTMFVS